ncbi:MAG: VCBS repeat-containing protein, partial [Pirellulaceae bacterium]
MDWDQDGHLDILSGCYWTENADGGHIQILRGIDRLKFNSAEPLTNAEGQPLLNTTIEKGEDANGGADNQIETICTQQHAVDYDNDGDLDLVTGCFGNSFYLYTNNGSDKQPALGQPEKLPIASPSYHSAPHLVDWDGDG